MKSDFRKLFVVAGEESGDTHGASLVEAIYNIDPHVEVYGIGGDRMKDAGVLLLEHSRNMAVMGFTEVISRYPFLKGVFRRTVRAIQAIEPARAILIDYPGFNLRLAKVLKTLGVPVTYFISPQLWAWKESRVKTIRDCVDQMLCIFPFEEAWYKKRGVDATFIGHPFLDRAVPSGTKEEFLAKHGLSERVTTVALFPGSRQQEVDRHLPVMIEAFQLLREKGLTVQAVLGKARGISIDSSSLDQVAIEKDEPHMVLCYADIAISSSGTATLEAVLYDTPTVVIYRMSVGTWMIARRLARVPYASMTNLIAGKRVFPELLQSEATPGHTAAVVRELIESEAAKAKMIEEMGAVRRKLGSPGACRRGAELILQRMVTV